VSSRFASSARPALALAALLSGAAGLGLEVLLVSLSGPAVGHGRAGALGVGVFIAAWALGAHLAGRVGPRAGRALAIAGLAVGGASLAAPALLLRAGEQAWPQAAALATAIACIAAVAVPQGLFLPLLARGWRAGERVGVGGLVTAGLTGAVLGAQLLGHSLPADRGRPAAAAVGGALALGAALAGAWGLHAARGSAVESNARGGGSLAPWMAGALLAFLTGWLASLEWIGLRLGVLWLGGMQVALTSVLCASLLALALGAALMPLLCPRGTAALPTLLGACALAPLWIWIAPRVGAMGELEGIAAALVLLGPALVPFGAAVPVLHREVRGASAERLSALLGWEAVGVLVGLPVSHLVAVPALGLGGTLGLWSLVAGAVALCFVRRHPAVVGAAATCALGAGIGALVVLDEPALASPALANPALAVLAFEEDQHFAVAVVDDGLSGERTLLTDGFRAAGTGRDYLYMRVLGHLPLLLHPAPKRVAVLALGTGTSAGAVALHSSVETIDVLELSASVRDQAHWFEEVNGGVLSDPRVRVVLGDGRRTLDARRGAFDVITMEPLLPDSPFGVYLYTREFYRCARRALAPGGLLCQWVPPHALEPATFDAVLDAFLSTFEWSGVWLFGTQVILVGGTQRPSLERVANAVVDDHLGGVLEALGIDGAAGVAAHFVAEGSAWPASARPLRDADPWVVYRPRRRGALVLGDLPHNLARLRSIEAGLPAPWAAALSAEDEARVAGGRALRRAREAQGAEEALARGVLLDAVVLRDAETELARARALDPDAPGLALLEEERRFLRALRSGVSLLRDPSASSARDALAELLVAAELRDERADVHLYLAVALERVGSSAAGAALRTALDLCPNLARTAPGRRAVELGLDLGVHP
jgi:spermidine synthase